MNNNKKYLLPKLLAPVAPKCKGIVSGKKQSATSTIISVANVMIIIVFFCFFIISLLISHIDNIIIMIILSQ